MLTRYRLALFVSSLAVGGALLACPHPDSVYEDFVNRVPDARAMNNSDAGCVDPIVPADVNGHFFLGLNDKNFGAFVFRFVVDVTFTPVAEGGMLTWVITPLGRDDGLIVRDNGGNPVPAVTVGPIAVGRCADFRLTKATFMIPGAATVSGSDATLSNVVLNGSIKDSDLMCGFATGQVTQPTGIPDLESGEGTSFGLVRIAPGTEGNALPPAVIACPDTGADAL
jgi:hypothetical protein